MNKKRVQKILKQNKENWEAIAGEFTKTRKWNWRELEFLSEYIKNGQKVLDLGCGNGRLYQLFEDKQVKYIGIDNSEKLVEIAKRKSEIRNPCLPAGAAKSETNSKSQILNPKPRFIVADALDLGTRFPSNEFDIIISVAFLHHIPSKELRLKILKDCFLVLKPNGFLIFTVWNLRQWKLILRYGLYSLFLGQRNVSIPWKAGGKKILRYYHVFTLREIKRLVKKVGFKIIKNKKDSLRGFNLVVVAQKVC
ncbi:hypothetical protein B6D52_02110 [Candidatus Parcubacteria bacterium 4484_255]|nr:MAG: hypothetical protein B6D52_02110 [Candidatus Parcubacteria bacterium 4484_255]